MSSTSRSPSSATEPGRCPAEPNDAGDDLCANRERGTGLVAAVFATAVLVALLLLALQVGLLLLARSETQALLGQATSDLALPSATPFAQRAAAAEAGIRHALGQAGTTARVEIWSARGAVHGSVSVTVPNVLPPIVTGLLGLAHVRTAAVAPTEPGGVAA